MEVVIEGEELQRLFEANTTQSIDVFLEMNSSGTTDGSVDLAAVNCPQMAEWEWNILDSFSFWIEGVFSCSLASTGLISNAVSAYILSR